MTGGGLVVNDVGVRFGGLTALDGLTLSAERGRLTGLIGPNGAGKTTFFNVVSGLVRPTRGSVELFGEDITRVSPSARARRGLGRTYQQVRLFDALTVAENVAMGVEAGLAGANPLRQLGSGRRVRGQIDEAASRAETICDVTSLRNLRPPQLSTGQRRLVELARAVAGGFKVLLLDEPSSGLDRNETRAMGRIFRELVEEHGLAILCVEHDMALVMSVCDYIHVIDFGRPIFEGTPREVGGSEIVRAAYLGSDAVEEAS